MKISTFLSQIDVAVTDGEIKSLDEGLSMVDLGASSLETLHKPKKLLAMLQFIIKMWISRKAYPLA